MGKQALAELIFARAMNLQHLTPLILMELLRVIGCAALRTG
jgi:hypothetical protein